MIDIDTLKRIAEVEFADIVLNLLKIEYKVRIILVDNSFIDIHLSQKIEDKFGFHWECMDANETIYRYDNFPDKKWQSVATYPYHFHNGSQDVVEPSPFPQSVLDGFRAFMEFVRRRLKK